MKSRIKLFDEQKAKVYRTPDLLVSPIALCEKMMAFRVILPQGSKFAAESHGSEIHLCLAGKVEATYDGDRVVLIPGRAVSFEAGVCYCLENSGTEEAVLLMITPSTVLALHRFESQP